jgi:hypothetical protein
MGFLNKLFGSDNSNNLTKTSEMLDENLYWQIVQESLNNSGTQDGQQEYLVRRIQKLNPKDIVGFRLRTDKLLYDTYNSEMWCAAYIMNGGCSDDSFEYFRNWVVSKGKDVYYMAKQNPDTLIEQVDKDAEYYDFEDFWYVALVAFKNKTGKDLYDFIDDDNFKFKEGHYPNFDFTWEEENPESLKAICPNLFDRTWK